MSRKTSGAPAAPGSSMSAIADTLTASAPADAAEVVLPAFPAAAIVEIDKAAKKDIAELVNEWLKAFRETPGVNPKDTKLCRRVERHVKFALDETEYFAEKTPAHYARGAMRAFFHDVPWTASLHKDSALKVIGVEKDSKKDATPAKADTAKREELDAAIIQAIQLARALGLKDAALALAKVAEERLTGFKVPADK